MTEASDPGKSQTFLSDGESRQIISRDSNGDEAAGEEPDTKSADSSGVGEPTTEAKPKKKGKRPGRAGSPNYTAEDINILLDCVEQHEPLGANEWALVRAAFSEEAQRVGRPERDQDSLKSKFDKLVNTKKKTGDPTCPPQVRRAKHIARDIMNKCSAMTINGETGSDSDRESVVLNEMPSGIFGSGPSSDGEMEPPRKKGKRAQVPVGARNSRRGNSDLIGHVGQMTKYIGSIAQSMSTNANVSETNSRTQRSPSEARGSVSREEVVTIVREELQHTNEMISEMKYFLQSMASQRSDSSK